MSNPVTIELEGLSLMLLPTPIAKLAKMQKVVTEKGWDSEEGIAAIIEAVFWGMRRAKTEVTLEWLQEQLDGINSAPVFAAFRDVNGMVKSSGNPPGASPS